MRRAVEDYTTLELVYWFYHTQDDDWQAEIYQELSNRGYEPKLFEGGNLEV
jgi:hypothetical protein